MYSFSIYPSLKALDAHKCKNKQSTLKISKKSLHFGMSSWRSSQSAFRQSTGNNVSGPGHYLLSSFSPSSNFLIEVALGSENKIRSKSGRECPKTLGLDTFPDHVGDFGGSRGYLDFADSVALQATHEHFKNRNILHITLFCW